jgi:hypothetical protein
VSPEKQALAVFWGHKRFFFFETLAIAAWTALALAWFWLPDSRVWGVALSALQGIVVIAAAAWLIGSALAFYRRAHAEKNVSLGPICRESLQRVPALLVWMAVFALAMWASLQPKAPAWIWILPAIVLLPLSAQVAAEGLRGLFRMAWRARYVPSAAVLVVAGTYIPYKLIAWHPQLSGLTMQTASLAVRFGLAYLLAVSAWLIMASLLAAIPARSN